jgi:hypothetical protein
LRGARCRAEWVRLPKWELRHANIDPRFARNARVIAKTADPFNTPRQVVVRELIYCINRAPNQQIITDRLSPFANNVLPFALNLRGAAPIFANNLQLYTTPEPTASTVPETSYPTTQGILGESGYKPWRAIMSAKLTPLARTRIRISPHAVGSADSRSCNLSGPP